MASTSKEVLCAFHQSKMADQANKLVESELPNKHPVSTKSKESVYREFRNSSRSARARDKVTTKDVTTQAPKSSLRILAGYN
jgi:hypothetical protein